MQKITSVGGLKNAIQLLEAEHTVKGELLREQFNLTYESFRPVNLLKNALKDISSSPYLVDDFLGTSIGLASGFLSKKLFIGTSGNVFRKLMGSLLQFGVTNIVSHHPESIKALGQIIFHYIFRKKETNSENL